MDFPLEVSFVCDNCSTSMHKYHFFDKIQQLIFSNKHFCDNIVFILMLLGLNIFQILIKVY